MRGIENLLRYIENPKAYIKSQMEFIERSDGDREDWDAWARSRARHYLKELEPSGYTSAQAKAEGVPTND